MYFYTVFTHSGSQSHFFSHRGGRTLLEMKNENVEKRQKTRKKIKENARRIKSFKKIGKRAKRRIESLKKEISTLKK